MGRFYRNHQISSVLLSVFEHTALWTVREQSVLEFYYPLIPKQEVWPVTVVYLVRCRISSDVGVIGPVFV